jgi:hypothetical protein
MIVDYSYLQMLDLSLCKSYFSMMMMMMMMMILILFRHRGISYITGRQDWRELFDVCIVNAAKPEFYRGFRPFRRVDVSSIEQSQCNTSNGSLVEEGYTWSTVTEFKPNEVYSGGNIHDFVRWTGWSGGSVIYIGDSIYTDLVDPALQYGWRTVSFFCVCE